MMQVDGNINWLMVDGLLHIPDGQACRHLARVRIEFVLKKLSFVETPRASSVLKKLFLPPCVVDVPGCHPMLDFVLVSLGFVTGSLRIWTISSPLTSHNIFSSYSDTIRHPEHNIFPTLKPTG